MIRIFATDEEKTAQGRAAANEHARRGFAYWFLAGCFIGGIFNFIGYTPGQVSYYFDASVPFDLEDVQAYVAEKIDTHPGDHCRVTFLPQDDYLQRFTNNTAIHLPTPALPSPCRIYFNSWEFFDPGFFAFVLTHELLHAWGLDHSTDPASLMYHDFLPGQELQLMDRFALWIAKQRFEDDNH